MLEYGVFECVGCGDEFPAEVPPLWAGRDLWPTCPFCGCDDTQLVTKLVDFVNAPGGHTICVSHEKPPCWENCPIRRLAGQIPPDHQYQGT